MDGPAPVPAGSAFLAATTNKSLCVVKSWTGRTVLSKRISACSSSGAKAPLRRPNSERTASTESSDMPVSIRMTAERGVVSFEKYWTGLA